MIAIGSDHAGYGLKQTVIQHLEDLGIAFNDYGTYSSMSCDYPDYAEAVCQAVMKGQADKGILICGTGIGMSMAANRHKEIRAALCDNCFSAKATREHNDANVLCMGARVLGEGLALQIVDTFLETEFSNGANHVRRIAKMS
jgi:ribose 5-phosphate isomerase B